LCPNACNGVRQIATNIELYARPYRRSSHAGASMCLRSST
jgi:hypothetical protein